MLWCFFTLYLVFIAKKYQLNKLMFTLFCCFDNTMPVLCVCVCMSVLYSNTTVVACWFQTNWWYHKNMSHLVTVRVLHRKRKEWKKTTICVEKNGKGKNEWFIYHKNLSFLIISNKTKTNNNKRHKQLW